MRTITPAQRATIEDMSAEGLLRALPVQTAEKDIHITDLLRGLSGLCVRHNHFSDLRRAEADRPDSGIQLVFAGGTCLSKAYGLIHRMSEDIDIKVVLKPTPKPLKKQRGDKSRLKALHDHVIQLLKQLDLSVDQEPHVRDTRRYCVINASYRSTYSEFLSLRPHLKLEMIQREPLLPLEQRQFGYLHETLAGIELSSTCSFSCISVAETAAEKVLSLLRRCAYQWDGLQAEGNFDSTLVRHVYDVACIAQKLPASLAAARSIFDRLVTNDRDEFKGQNPNFDDNPIDTLKRTLLSAKTNGILEQLYKSKLLPLVYEPDPPSFERSFEIFESVASDFLENC